MYSHLDHQGTAITVTHTEAQDLLIVDRLIEPQTIAHFLEFAVSAPLPNGSQPASVTRLTFEEMSIIQSPFPPGSNGKPIIARVMSRIGSVEDDSRLCLIGKNLHALKSRLWEGIIPVTEQRWQEQGFDQSDNFDLACQCLSAVVAVFEYLNNPPVQAHLRDAFNLIHDHWTELDTELNRLRAEKGQEPVSVAGLWTMYMTAHFEVMTERAHRWVIAHVKALRAPVLQALDERYSITRGRQPPNHLEWKLGDRLHMLAEVTGGADYTILIPMDGYQGYTPAGQTGVASLAQRKKAYGQRVKLVFREVIARNRLHTQDLGYRNADAGPGELPPWESDRLARAQIEAQNQVRREIRGAPIEPIPREPWITSRMEKIENWGKPNKPTQLGLLIYRLTYGQTESDWSQFVKKLEVHISDWGKGQTGSAAIKPHLSLHWLDGKALGIAEDDIAAAKRHFNDTANDGLNLPSLEPHRDVFLVIDSASFASYMTSSYSAATDLVIPGDFKGFLLSVDAGFDPQEGPSRPDASPGYSGQMRILGSLVWGDLYALLASQSSSLEELWPLAMTHPNQVYVGPIIPLQEFNWRTQNAIRWIALREVIEYAKRKMGLSTITTTSVASGPASGLTSGMTAGDEPTSSTTPAAGAQEPAVATLPAQPPTNPPHNLFPQSVFPNIPVPPEMNTPMAQLFRQAMQADFRRWLINRGLFHEAAWQDVTSRLATGEQVNMDEVRRQEAVLVEEQRQRQHQQEQGGGDGSADDPSQNGGSQFQPPCPPM